MRCGLRGYNNSHDSLPPQLGHIPGAGDDRSCHRWMVLFMGFFNLLRRESTPACEVALVKGNRKRTLHEGDFDMLSPIRSANCATVYSRRLTLIWVVIYIPMVVTVLMSACLITCSLFLFTWPFKRFRTRRRVIIAALWPLMWSSHMCICKPTCSITYP